jgi:hypothetical protein
MMGKPINFNLSIIYAMELPEDLANDVYIEYIMPDWIGSQTSFRTEVVAGNHLNPNFNFVKLHKIKKVTDEIFAGLKEDQITFKVYGRENMESIVRFNTMV